jgi:hypothetical protein
VDPPCVIVVSIIHCVLIPSFFDTRSWYHPRLDTPLISQLLASHTQTRRRVLVCYHLSTCISRSSTHYLFLTLVDANSHTFLCCTLFSAPLFCPSTATTITITSHRSLWPYTRAMSAACIHASAASRLLLTTVDRVYVHSTVDHRARARRIKHKKESFDAALAM